MSRNLYILGATLLLFSLISCAMTFASGPYQIGLPGNGSLWKMISLFLLVVALIAIFGGVMSQMFEQVERRAEERHRLKGNRKS
jgi:hypothetical protein